MIGISWADRENKRHDWAHVLELRDGKIYAIKDYASPSRAALVTRLRATLKRREVRRPGSGRRDRRRTRRELQDEPVDALVAAAADSDLLVVGSRMAVALVHRRLEELALAAG